MKRIRVKLKKAIIILILALSVAGSSQIAFAGVNLVCDSSGCSLRYVDVAGSVYYGRTVVVGKSGGDYDDPYEAMLDVNAWCPARAETLPCLMKIMPGEYDLGTNALQMVQYVDIEGSGENMTRIKGNPNIFEIGVINGSSNAELRYLTVENNGGSTYARAICNQGASPRISHVTARVSGGSHSNYAIYNQVGSSPVINAVTVEASGGEESKGIFNYNGSSPSISDVRVTVTGSYAVGIDNYVSSNPVIKNAYVNASGNSNTVGLYINGASTAGQDCSATVYDSYISADGTGGGGRGVRLYPGATARIYSSIIIGTAKSVVYGATPGGLPLGAFLANSRIDGEIDPLGLPIVCVNSYNGSYSPLNASCQ